MMMILPGTLSIAITPFVIFWLPKSPCFMVVYGQMASATELFRNKLRVPEAEAEERIRQLRVVANISPMVENVNTRTIIRPRSGGIDRMWSQFRDSVDMVLFVAFLHILRVMSGEYFVATHLDVILALYGYQSMATILKAKLIITAARLGSSLIPLALVDCCGRRALLVISMSVTAIATGVVGVSTFLNEGGMIGDRAIFLLTVGGSLAIEIGMGLGLGGIPWLFGPEAFQLPSRVLGVGAGVICGEILGSVVDLRGVSIFESRKTAARLMLLSTLLLSVGAVSCFLCINKPTARRILTDAETEPPSPPEEQPDVARA
ncbi:Probable polyol transporter 6 [Linum grandiflorum]